MKQEKKNQIKGIIFDFDETLVNTRIGMNSGLKEISTRIYHYFQEKNLFYSLDKLYQKLCEIAHEMEEQRIYDRNIWWKVAISEVFQVHASKTFLSKLTEEYWRQVIEKSTLYNDTLTTLRYLKTRGYLLGLLADTDGIKDLKNQRIKLSNLDQWFNEIIIAGEDTKMVKPFEEPFYLISQKLGLPPKKCAFVGDKPFTDIEGAKKVGMYAILIKRQNWKIKEKPDLIMKELNELKKYF